jgi:hypothetical protein
MGGVAQAEPPPLPEGNFSLCGSCPSGYAQVGLTRESAQCGDQPLAHCVPLGAPTLSVCGFCPEGYSPVGSSIQPGRCGKESPAITQCQLQKLEGGVSGPGQGGVFCPPNCAGTLGTPGTTTPPPVYRK